MSKIFGKNKNKKESKEKISKNDNKNNNKKKTKKKSKKSSVIKETRATKKQRKKAKKENKKKNYTIIYQIGIILFMIYVLLTLLMYMLNKPIPISGEFVQIDENFAKFVPNLSKVKIAENIQLKDLSIKDTVYVEYNKDKNSWSYSKKNNIFKRYKLKGDVINKGDYYLNVKFNILNVKLDVLESLSIPLNYEVEVNIKKYFSNYKVFFNINDVIDNTKNNYKKQIY